MSRNASRATSVGANSSRRMPVALICARTTTGPRSSGVTLIDIVCSPGPAAARVNSGRATWLARGTRAAGLVGSGDADVLADVPETGADATGPEEAAATRPVDGVSAPADSSIDPPWGRVAHAAPAAPPAAAPVGAVTEVTVPVVAATVAAVAAAAVTVGTLEAVPIEAGPVEAVPAAAVPVAAVGVAALPAVPAAAVPAVSVPAFPVRAVPVKEVAVNADADAAVAVAADEVAAIVVAAVAVAAVLVAAVVV